MNSSMIPKVSVIIPCFNYGRYLPDALNSLIGQSLQDWECILINNGSADNTRQVVEQYAGSDSRFIYVETDKSGPSAARNAGIRLARSPYIQFLDADDMLEKEKLAVHVLYLETNSGSGLVYGPARYFTDQDPTRRDLSLWDPERKWMPEISGRGYPLIKTLLRYNIMTINSPVFRKSILEMTDVFSESMHGFEDWDLWLRMALEGVHFSFVDAPETLALVRSHGSSLNKDTYTMRKDLLRIWLNTMQSGKLPAGLWPYALLRFMDEYINSFYYAIRSRDLKLMTNNGLSPGLRILCLLLIPVFIPIAFIVKLLRYSRLKISPGKKIRD